MMRLVRYLQHWLGGAGPRLQVADFVPDTHPIRQWADTFPWAALVAAVEHSFANAFPNAPHGDEPLCRSECCWLWSCSNMNWALPMRISATACVPTLR